MAETDTNAYDSTFTDFHALPFTLRSSAMPAMPQPTGVPPSYMHARICMRYVDQAGRDEATKLPSGGAQSHRLACI